MSNGPFFVWPRDLIRPDEKNVDEDDADYTFAFPADQFSGKWVMVVIGRHFRGKMQWEWARLVMW